MKSVTRSKLQELVERLPETKLPLAYDFLTDLTDESNASSPDKDVMHLSLVERRRLMKRQAEQMINHYEETRAEREVWQAGNFVDED